MCRQVLRSGESDWLARVGQPRMGWSTSSMAPSKAAEETEIDQAVELVLIDLKYSASRFAARSYVFQSKLTSTAESRRGRGKRWEEQAARSAG
jgi:hypothetical protein